ncbi:MAG: hypothetical protein AB9869_36920 [Verrucomicrobiia bacterium]
MQITQQVNTHKPLKFRIAQWAVIGALAALPAPAWSAEGDPQPTETHVTIKAGTVFVVTTAFDANGVPIFPWPHEVRGIVQVSNLGNCHVGFNVSINGGSACEGNHLFCLAGTMTITTLEGDKLFSNVVGWADPDPNDKRANPSMYVLHYDATITGGTGKLAGSSGQGLVGGAFMFSDTDATDDTDNSDNAFCGYAGVATWQFDGVVQTPPQLKVEPASDKKVVLSWPASAQAWSLQQNSAVGNSGWTDVAATPDQVGDRKQVATPSAVGEQFFRLRKQ